MKIIIFLILLYSINILGQGLGFSVDFSQLNGLVQESGPPVGISFLGNKEILPNLYVEGRVGYQTLVEEYAGWEASFYTYYNLTKFLHVIGGINYHLNEGGELGHSSGVLSGDIMSYGLGAGVDFSSHASLEFLYFIPFERKHWISHRGDALSPTRYEDLIAVVRVDFKFYWKL